MRLILVRHGQTTSNVAGLLDTDEPGAGLTALGLEQAAALPSTLCEESIEALYTSTLVRTQQTAAPLASFLGLDVRIREGLREVRAGSLEMLGDDASVRTYLDTTFSWSSGDVHLRMPGAESGAEVFARYDAVVEEVAGSGAGTAAIVSHGSVIRAWTAARARNITPDFTARNPLGNTGTVLLEGSPLDGWNLLTWEGRPVLDGELRLM
ncbi:MAG: histidine phosphatase family protein [Cellulomonas sp.]